MPDPERLGDYNVYETLGKGGQGIVKRGEHCTTKQQVALKLINKSKLRQGTKAHQNLVNEISALRALSSSYITKLYEPAFEAEAEVDGKIIPVIVLVLELVTGGELFPYLECGPFPTEIARIYFSQLVEAIEHCHQRSVVHRDLKPENLLISSEFTLKVTDFGLCKIVQSLTDEEMLLRTRCGTITYMAPEIIKSYAYKGSSCDIWSMGILLFLFVFGSPPLEKASESCWWYRQIKTDNLDKFWKQHMKYNPNHRSAFTPDIMNLIERMLDPNPDTRITINEIKVHPWFTTGVLVIKSDPAGVSRLLHSELRQRQKKIAFAKQQSALSSRGNSSSKEGSDLTCFDVFTRDTVRSGEGEDEPLAFKLPNDESPFFMGIGTRFNDCYSDQSAALIGAKVFAILTSLKFKVMEGANYSYSGTMVNKNGGEVTISIEIYDVSPEFETGLYHLLKIDKRSGDLLAFNEILKQFYEMFGNFMIPDPTVPTDSFDSSTPETSIVELETSTITTTANDVLASESDTLEDILDDLSLDDEDTLGPATF